MAAGDSSNAESDKELLLAVRNLRDEVAGLRADMKKYPSREEVTREGRSRAFKTLGFGIILILIAQSFTMSTISYCFLQPLASEHTLCEVMPGYGKAVEDGNLRLARFELLFTETQKNKAELRELNLRISRLEQQMGIASEGSGS